MSLPFIATTNHQTHDHINPTPPSPSLSSQGNQQDWLWLPCLFPLKFVVYS